MALTVRSAEHRLLTALKRAAWIRRGSKPDVEGLCDLHDLGTRSYLTGQVVSDAVLVEGQGDRRWECRRAHRDAVAGAPAAGLAGPGHHGHRYLRDGRCLGQDHLVAELVERVCLSTLRRHRNDAC